MTLSDHEIEALMLHRMSLRSRVLCLVTPLFFWLVVFFLQIYPGLLGFMGEGTWLRDGVIRDVQVIRESIFKDAVTLFLKPISGMATSLSAVMPETVRSGIYTLVVVFCPFVFVSLMTLFISLFFSSRAYWTSCWINIALIFWVVVPALVVLNHFPEIPRHYLVSMVEFYALSVLYMLFATLGVILVAAFIGRKKKRVV